MSTDKDVMSQAQENVTNEKRTTPKIMLPVGDLANNIRELTTQYLSLSAELKRAKELLKAEKKRAEQAEKNAIAWKEKAAKAAKNAIAWKEKAVQAEEWKKQAVQAEEMSKSCRTAAWNLVRQLNTVTEFTFGQNSEYGKLCSKNYIDLQQLLGNDRAGVETCEQRKDVLRAMRHFVSERSREQEIPELPQDSMPPEDWQIGTAVQKLMAREKKVFLPERLFRLMTEKLLVVLEEGSAEQIIQSLRSCGIDAIFYEDASEEFQNPEYFGIYNSGIDVPVLVSRTAESGEFRVLSRGAHVVKAERE